MCLLWFRIKKNTWPGGELKPNFMMWCVTPVEDYPGDDALEEEGGKLLKSCESSSSYWPWKEGRTPRRGCALRRRQHRGQCCPAAGRSRRRRRSPRGSRRWLRRRTKSPPRKSIGSCASLKGNALIIKDLPFLLEVTSTMWSGTMVLLIMSSSCHRS